MKKQVPRIQGGEYENQVIKFAHQDEYMHIV